jgi:hypothetical protein
MTRSRRGKIPFGTSRDNPAAFASRATLPNGASLVQAFCSDGIQLWSCKSYRVNLLVSDVTTICKPAGDRAEVVHDVRMCGLGRGWEFGAGFPPSGFSSRRFLPASDHSGGSISQLCESSKTGIISFEERSTAHLLDLPLSFVPLPSHYQSNRRATQLQFQVAPATFR